MKQTLLAIICMLVLHAASAQPLITSSVNPVAGDVFNMHTYDPTGIVQGPSGAGVTWDFSALSSSLVTSLTMLSCSSTPPCDSFPGANLAFFASGTYSYYGAYPSTFELMGTYDSGGHSMMRYSNPTNMLRYPITYNTIYVDSTYGFDRATNEYYSTIDTFTADGYGTLIVPGGRTYTNALRLRDIKHITDSFPAASYVARQRHESYYWLVPDRHFIVFEIDLLDFGTGVAGEEVTYSEIVATAVANVNAQQLNVQAAPNPAHGSVTIQFTTSDAAHSAITFTDVTGRCISVAHDAIKNGDNVLSCDLSDVAPGLYFAVLHTPDGSATQKIEIY